MLFFIHSLMYFLTNLFTNQNMTVAYEKMKNMCNIFDCTKNIEKSTRRIFVISSLLIDFENLWNDYDSILIIMDKMKSMEWWNLDPGPLEEIRKSLFLIFRFVQKKITFFVLFYKVSFLFIYNSNYCSPLPGYA